MIVNCINNISYPYSQPSFKHYNAKKKTMLYSFYTCTEFFRQDLAWNRFIDLLKMKYKNADKVNIICHACSDGEEVYSLALKLIAKLGKEAEKFFPIIARDIDFGNICLAKEGNYTVCEQELERINEHSEYNINKFFDISRTGQKNLDEESTIKAKDILKDNIIFEQGDILNDVKQFSAENTVLMCRNFWPYMPINMIKSLSEKLGKYISPSSLLAIGEWDMHNRFTCKSLEENGFVMSNLKGIYYKSENKYKPANLMNEMYLYLSKKN